MTSGAKLVIKYQLSPNRKTKSNLQEKQARRPHHRIHSLKFVQTNNPCYMVDQNSTMSKALQDELDRKIQQVREYGLIAYGYSNENMQYPVHVRRSHDGEKVSRISVTVAKSNSIDEKSPFPNTTVLTSSSHENRTKTKQKEVNNRLLSYDERRTTLITPPNKTVNDINPSFRCDTIHTTQQSSSTNSCLTYDLSRPPSSTSLSLAETNERQSKYLSSSIQPLITQLTPAKTFKQRFFSKFFHHPSKS